MLGLHIITTAKLEALKAQGHTVATAAVSSLSTAVTLAAQAGNPIGVAARAAIDAAEATGKPGADKKLAAIAAVAPIVVAEAARGGFSAIAKDGETFAGLVIEEVLTSVKQTPLVAIGMALLKLLGIVH